MKLIADIKLKPTEAQADSLKRTLETANAAANFLSDIAWDTQTFRQFDLHHAGYHTMRDKFSLRGQRAILHSWSFHQLRSFIEYKAQCAGVPVVVVDPRNTSRTCPCCGHIDKANRPHQSTFLCVACGFSGLADHVAASNIASRAVVSRPDISTTNVQFYP